MAQRSSKHSEVKTVNFGFDGGLNLHDSPANIADNQMIEARNYYYADKGGLLVTRPGVKLVTQARIGEVLLTVILHPAQGGWRIVGSTDWLPPGSSLVLQPGSYSVEYQDVDEYTTPSGSTISVFDNTVVHAYYRVVRDFVIKDLAPYGTWATAQGDHPDEYNSINLGNVWVIKAALPIGSTCRVLNFQVAFPTNDLVSIRQSSSILTFFLRVNAAGQDMWGDIKDEYNNYWRRRDKSGDKTTENFCIFDKNTSQQIIFTEQDDPMRGVVYKLSPDISDAINEIISQNGWQSGSQIALYGRPYPTDYDLEAALQGFGGMVDSQNPFPHCRFICTYELLF